MKKLLLTPISLLIIHLICFSQTQDKWDLRRCVEYAVANNISVKQADIQARIAKLTLDQNKWNQAPTAILGGNAGVVSGRSFQNYTVSNLSYFTNNYSLQSNTTLFNFLSIRKAIDASKFSWQAALASSEKTKNDISLNVANAYLQVLLAREQSEASQLQLHLSQSQLEITRKQVKAGTLPELNAAELESQVAQDSSTYISSKGNIDQAMITLKAYMDLDASVPFEVDTPPVDDIPIEKLADLQPEAVYFLALNNQPLQKMDSFLIQSARMSVRSAKGAMYPTISLSAQLSSNFSSQNKIIDPNSVPIFKTDTLAGVRVAGTTTPVVQDMVQVGTKTNPYFSQLNQSFGEFIGLSINIPILNNLSLRTNYLKSKLNLRNQELQRDQDNLTLKNNIYQAYTAAITALQKYEANKITLAATEKSFNYAEKRYKVGILNTIDLLTNQNNYFNAKINLLSSHFDYVFKMKVLEFYKGLGIKLSKE